MQTSISRRLLLTTVGVTSIAVALAGGVLLRQQHRELYRGFEEGTLVLARAVVEHCSAPLVFGDPEGSDEILAKLERSTNISRAVLYDRHGIAVSSWDRPGREHPRVAVKLERWKDYQDGYLHVFEPVLHQGELEGMLYIAAPHEGLDQRISAATALVLGAGSFAILAAAVLAWILQRSITRPILRLARTMGRINDEKALSVRVDHVSDDEIGVLYGGFNRMVAQLATRERERDRSVARLRALIAALPDPVFVLDHAGRIVEILAGRPDPLPMMGPDVNDRPLAEVIGLEDAERLSEAIAKALASDVPQRLTYEVELPEGQRCFDAALVPMVGEPRVDGAKRVVLFVPRDITERQTLELELRQAQKMEALGRLAGGVAHDFNNILTAIMGYGSLLIGRLESQGAATAELAEILKAAERAAMLTQQLLAFSRRQVVAHRHVSMTELVRDMQRMLDRIIGEDVQLVADLAPNLPPVHFDPGQLQQVILNLAVNAREAMPGGGTLTLTTRLVSQSVRRVGEPALPPGRYVLVRVADNGVGMDEAIRARIFEPFFTTKGRKGGTGLGLAMVYGIIRQAGGDITVSSQLNRGSSFNIYLPVASPETVTVGPTVDPAPLPRGTETVLVVEDEPQLLDLTCRMLQEQGYEVLRASDARQALALCESFPRMVHLLLTDVVMPKMGGGELVNAALRLRPGMRVLYMSGYTDGTTVHYGVTAGQVPFLQKPFTPRELTEQVREVLDEAVTAPMAAANPSAHLSNPPTPAL